MFKYSFLLGSLFFFYNLQGQISNYKITYTFDCIGDTIQNTYTYPEKYLLYRVGDESRFLSCAKYYNDSITLIFKKEHPDPSETGRLSQLNVGQYMQLLMEHRTKFKRTSSEFYTNRTHSGKDCITFAPGKLIPAYFKEKIQHKWSITNDVDVINGLSCTKATTRYGGRRYTAWFAPSIPIDDGPYVFSGLPGLIVKVEDDRRWYRFTVSDIDLEGRECYWEKELLHRSYREISRKEYVKWTTKLLTNPDVPVGVTGDMADLKLRLREKYKNRFDLLLEQME